MSSFFIRIPMMLPKKENKKAILSFLFELVPNFSKENVENKPTIKTARSDFFKMNSESIFPNEKYKH